METIFGFETRALTLLKLYEIRSLTIRVIGKNRLSPKSGKVEKINLRIMSKQHAHPHTMAKTSVKFQNDWPKTVGEVELTKHPLTTRVLGKN